MRTCYSLRKGHLALIIFTVTNKVTSQVYVGSTRNDLASQWEKMLAAADQNLDFPLYREIRMHGCDCFQVEEWDFTDDRGELAQLEREALEVFNAKSLKGYKTSTVKIQPKKKIKQYKSNLEKELASLFEELSSISETEEPVSINDEKQPSEAAAIKPAIPPVEERGGTASQKMRAIKPTKTATTAQGPVEPQEIQEQHVVPEKNEPVATGSQANAIVHLNHIDLSSEITTQLAAIEAAADAALAGDTVTATQLCAAPNLTELNADVNHDSTEAVVTAEEPKPEQDENEPPSPKELRLRKAVAKHRLNRTQKTSEVAAAEKQHIASLLAELEAKAVALFNGSMAVAA